MAYSKICFQPEGKVQNLSHVGNASVKITKTELDKKTSELSHMQPDIGEGIKYVCHEAF